LPETRQPPRTGEWSMHFGNMKTSDQAETVLLLTASLIRPPQTVAKLAAALMGNLFNIGVSRVQMSMRGTKKDPAEEGVAACGWEGAGGSMMGMAEGGNEAPWEPRTWRFSFASRLLR